MMQLVDTHVHLNFDSFDDDLDAVAVAWREAGVVRLVHSCVEPSEFPKMQTIADRFPELFLAVGLHPLDVHQWVPDMAHQIAETARSDGRVVAIGETGLDFYKADNAARQWDAFEAQLQVARELQLPVIIHCRDAAPEMASRLRQLWDDQGPVSGVMHCWAGTPEETQVFLDLGFHISFSGIVTFKNAHQVKASAQLVPQDRILVETDCPFLSPVPCRKVRRNQPAFVSHVAQYVAELRGEALPDFAAATTRNALALFQLPPLVAASAGTVADVPASLSHPPVPHSSANLRS